MPVVLPPCHFSSSFVSLLPYRSMATVFFAIICRVSSCVILGNRVLGREKKWQPIALKIFLPLRLSGPSNSRSHPGFGVTIQKHYLLYHSLEDQCWFPTCSYPLLSQSPICQPLWPFFYTLECLVLIAYCSQFFTAYNKNYILMPLPRDFPVSPSRMNKI